VADGLLDAGSKRNVWKRIEGHERPAWSDVTSTGTFRVNPGQTFDRHYHDCDEYWFIREGRAVIEIDDERYAVEAGDIVCTEMGREHDFLQVLEPVTGFWFEAVLKLDGELGKGRAGHLHRSPERAAGHRVLGPDEALAPISRES
jgi:mannose-6-phosphate isomerase-like protein (cupin superfamily)